jgi:hypothetical protein
MFDPRETKLVSGLLMLRKHRVLWRLGKIYYNEVLLFVILSKTVMVPANIHISLDICCHFECLTCHRTWCFFSRILQFLEPDSMKGLREPATNCLVWPVGGTHAIHLNSHGMHSNLSHSWHTNILYKLLFIFNNVLPPSSESKICMVGRQQTDVYLHIACVA